MYSHVFVGPKVISKLQSVIKVYPLFARLLLLLLKGDDWKYSCSHTMKPCLLRESSVNTAVIEKSNFGRHQM